MKDIRWRMWCSPDEADEADGIEVLFLTNAAGGINRGFRVG